MDSVRPYDVKVVFGECGEEISTYSDFLRAESEILNEMIPLDNPKPDIVIYDVSPSIFCDALKCICTCGESIDNVALAVTLRAIGKAFKMKRLLTYCEEFLVQNLNAQNVGEIYELACQYSDECIQYCCWRVFDTSWRRIFANHFHYKYSLSTMMLYLLRPVYSDMDEYILWTALCNWCLNQSNCNEKLSPREALKEFLPHIRFLTMTMVELEEVFASKVLTQEECDAIMQALITFDVTNLPVIISRETVPRGKESEGRYVSHISYFYFPKHCLLRSAKVGDTFYSEFTVKKDCFLTSVALPLRGFAEPVNGILEITRQFGTKANESDTQHMQLLTPFLFIYPPLFIEDGCTVFLNFVILETSSSCLIEPYASCNIYKDDKRTCEDAEEWKSFYINDVLLYF